jgi:tetratricopeptide (TPR) repeat protein
MKPLHLPPSFRIISCSLLACFTAPFVASQTDEPESPLGGVLPAVQALVNANKRDEALAKLQQALRDPGAEPDHPATATLHIAQARILRDLGRHGEAATSSAAAATIYEKAMGADNPFAMHARWMAATQAMSAKQPAEAATHATALLKTYSTYVNSGAAERAQWESVPQAAPLFKEMPAFNEAGFAAITALLGRAWEAAGETEKALPLLREAAASLERLHGPGHPDLVDLTEALERIAAKRGEALGTRYVGSLGYFSKLVFEGNTLMPADVLRSGLNRDVETVYASHPAADLADFLTLLSRQITLGYLNSGFPGAKAEAVLDRTQDGSRILVRITEGPRFLKGKILVEGAKDIDADKLCELLQANKDTPKARSLVGQIREVMTKEEKWLPKPESKAAKDMLDALNQQLGALKWSTSAGNSEAEEKEDDEDLPSPFLINSFASSSTEGEWQAEDPVAFKQDKANPLADAVRRHLAALGRPLTRFRTRYVLDGDGTADLVIHIEDEGPVAVIGRIEVVGAKEHRPDEITVAAGLKSGGPLTPEVLDRALLALWETGRFYPFSISPVARSADAREVDLLIQTREIPEVPRLNAKLPPELEVARRFIQYFNEWTASGSDDDLLVTTDAQEGQRITIGLSIRDGYVVDAMSKDDAIRATASMARDNFLIHLQRDERDSVIRLPLPVDRFKGFAQLLPDPEDGKMSVGVGGGFAASANENGLPATNIIISPALPLLKADDFRVADDGFVEFLYDGRALLRLDPTTAMPVSTEHTRIEFRPGAVKELQQAVAAEIKRPGGDNALGDWIEGARTLLRLAEKEGGFEDLAKLEVDKWLNFAAALAKPEVTKPFVDLWTRWIDDHEDRETFTIPLDPATLQQAGAVNLLVSFGAVGFAEMLAPPDTWVAKLAREVVFIQGGNTRYTARTMDELLADPSMGPLGCYLAARIMSRYDGDTAFRFLHKARAQANAAAFRHDWQLALDSPTGIGRAAQDTLAALGSLPPQQETELAALLDPAQAKWLRGFLDRCRAKPEGKNLTEWLTPTMDDLWNRLLREDFLSCIESLLNPSPDADLVAATVDGSPIARSWLKKLDDEGYCFLLLPRFKSDPARKWTQQPMLAETIRLLLWKKSWSGNSANVQPGAQDAAAAADLTQQDFQRIGAEANALVSAIPEPEDPELAAWWLKRAASLGRQCHLHSIRVTAPDQQPESLQRATRIAREAAALLRDGLPFATLSAATEKDEGCNVVVSCDKKVALLDMNPHFYQELVELKPGEVPSVVGINTLRWTAHLVGWNDTPPPSLEDARDCILDAWKAESARQALQQKLATLERAADIRVLDTPEPPADPPSMFREILEESPASPLARLAVFWQQAIAKDPAAAGSFEKVLASGTLNATSLAQLETALRNRGLTALADHAKAAAAER